MTKHLFNLTTSRDDLNRFADRAELLELMQGFDGIELLVLDEDENNLIPRDKVIGLHMNFAPTWLDLWQGDEAALLREFGSLEVVQQQFGGLTRQALIDRYRRDLQQARAYGVEYVVFHVSESTIEESFKGVYRHRDEAVATASIELLNQVFEGFDPSCWLLLENLWQAGLTFTRPEITRLLLEGVRHPSTGLMLDLGHLLHTEPTLSSLADGLAYIHRQLDAHGPLCAAIQGVHLHQSLSGSYILKTRQNPPRLAADYLARTGQMIRHALAMDRHEPFCEPGIRELIGRIAPRYLTFEFITEDLAQHKMYLAQQRRALGLGD